MIKRFAILLFLPSPLLLLLLGLSGCSSPSDKNRNHPNTDAVWFEEISKDAGLVFKHSSGQSPEHHMPEIVGGGVALFDLENDGDLDVYFIQSGDLTQQVELTNKLFRNDGNGTFEDITASSGAGDTSYGMGVATGDFNGDGLTDLYVTNVGANVLLANQGQGRFLDVTTQAGVANPSWSTGAAFVDYDADGDLDLFVLNYINWSLESDFQCFSDSQREYCSPLDYSSPAADTLYRNNGDGTFSDVTKAAGILANYGNGLGVVTAKFDGDPHIDIFVANDNNPDQLWVNKGNGTFYDDASYRGVAVDLNGINKAGMGVTIGDVDQDDDEDLLVVNIGTETDSFFRNDGRFFTDITGEVGLRVASRPYTRFGVGLVDFNNDGWLDLYEANGRVTRQSGELEDAYAEQNLLFSGSQGGFKEVAKRGGTNRPLIATSRAAAFGDLDGDGGVDIVVVNRDSEAYVLRNRVGSQQNWIRFNVLLKNNASALNAVISLESNKQSLRRQVLTAYSYLAANEPTVHFGLGSNDSNVTKVRVTWLDGTVEYYGDYETNQVVTLVKGQGKRE